jgi:polyhydroxyalkanoate synthesis regulator phasin
MEPTGNPNEHVQSFPVSALNSPGIDREVKDVLWGDVQPGERGTYQRRSHKMLSEQANKLIEESPEAAYQYATSPEVLMKEPDLTVAVGIKLADHYQKNGNAQTSNEILNYVADHLTRAGQTASAARMIEKLSPEGVVMRAQKEAKKALDELPKPKKEKLDQTTEQVKQEFDEVNKETVEQVIEATPELQPTPKGKSSSKGTTGEAKPREKKQADPGELLAQRIKNYVTEPAEEAQEKRVKQIVDTLFKKAKEVLPGQKVLKGEKRSELETVAEALNHSQEYRKAWEDAKAVLAERYGDAPQIMKDVDVYVEHYLNVPYSERSLDRILQEAIKDTGFDLEKSAFGPMSPTFEGGIESQRDLIRQIIKKSGLTGQNADTLAMELGTKLEEKAKGKRDKKTAQLADKIIKMATENPQGEAATNPIQEMFNILFQKAKEAMPKVETGKTPAKDPMIGIYNALNNRPVFNRVWVATKKEIVQKLKAKGVSVEGANLDQLFSELLYHPYSQTQLDKAVRTGIKNYDVEIGQIVRQHFTTQESAGQSLAEKLVTRGMLTEDEAAILSQDIMTRFNEIATQKKQQILNQIFKKRTIGRTKPKPIDQKIIEWSNLGALGDAQYRNLIAEKLELPVLTEGMSNQLWMLADKAQTSTGREQEVARAKIKKIINELTPSTTADKINGIRRISMLLNPRTLISRNMGGNIILAAFENIKDVPASMADIATTAYLKNKGVDATRTTLMPSPKGTATQAKGAVEGWGLLADDIKHGVDTAPRGQYELPTGRTFKNRGLNFLDQLTTRGLQAGDRPFYEAAKQETLRQQMKIHGVSEPTEAMVDFAKRVAADRTFQNESSISDAVKFLRRGLNKLGTVGGLGLGDIAIPFAKTPGNILDKIVDYSPIGFIRAAKEAYRGRVGEFDQKSFVDSIGRAVTGTAVIVLGYDLAKSGVITGQADKDKDIASMQRRTGINPYSYNASGALRLIRGENPRPKKGDIIRTYDFAAPVAVGLAIGADMYASNKDRKATSNMVVEAIKGGGNTLMKQSVLQGVTRMVGGYDVMEGVLDTLLQVPLQFVPSLSGQAAKATDDSYRETYDPDATQEVANRIKAKIPGMSDDLPAKYDVLGKPIKSVQGGNSAWNTFINPGVTTEYKPNDIDQMIMDVYKQTGDKTIFPRTISAGDSKLTVSGRDFQLNGKELARYQKLMGEKTAQGYSEIPIDDIAPEEAAKMMKKVLENASVESRYEILSRRGIPVEITKQGLKLAT